MELNEMEKRIIPEIGLVCVTSPDRYHLPAVK